MMTEHGLLSADDWKPPPGSGSVETQHGTEGIADLADPTIDVDAERSTPGLASRRQELGAGLVDRCHPPVDDRTSRGAIPSVVRGVEADFGIGGLDPDKAVGPMDVGRMQPEHPGVPCACRFGIGDEGDHLTDSQHLQKASLL